MTAAEKAKELYDQFYVFGCGIVADGKRKEYAKKCALVCAESHIYSENNCPFPTIESWLTDNRYWKSVIEEIHKFT